MDYELIKLFLGIAQWVTTAGVGIYVYAVNRNRVTNDRITQLEANVDDRLDGQGERIAKLETEVKLMPNHADLSNIHEKVNGIANTMGEIKGELTALNRNFTLLFEDRLQGGR